MRKRATSEDALILFDNVQFIYELALAELELQAFEVSYQITNGLRTIKVLNDPDYDLLRKRLAYFKLINNQLSDYSRICARNRTRSANQYLTHWIYPYKGKFHPQMIRALLNILKLKPGETVLDPFIGSGTTAVEALLLGINCVGIDISPLCVIQSKVKTESVFALNEILRARNSVVSQCEFPLGKGVVKNLYETIWKISNPQVRDFYLMAYLVAVSDRERRRKDFNTSFITNVDRMIGSVSDLAEVAEELSLRLGRVDIRRGDCRKIDLRSNSVDGIITSPPYSVALDYVANDAHALRLLEYDLESFREQFVGVRGRGSERVELYNQDMIACYKEMFRVLKKGRCAAIVIGNATYNGEEIKTVEFTIEQCERLGFKLVRNLEKIIFGLYNVMQKESILIFKKVGR